MIQFFVQGEPLSKARPRTTRGGGAYTPKPTREAERRVRDAFTIAHPDHVAYTCDLHVEVHVYRATHVRRDLDNQVKLVCDALNGLAWKDDQQIEALVCYRHWVVEPDVPGVWVQITRVPLLTLDIPTADTLDAPTSNAPTPRAPQSDPASS